MAGTTARPEARRIACCLQLGLHLGNCPPPNKLHAARCMLHFASHRARACRHLSSALADACLFLLMLSSEHFAGVPVDHLLGLHPGWDQTPGGPVFSQPKGQSSKSGASRGRSRVVTIVPRERPECERTAATPRLCRVDHCPWSQTRQANEIDFVSPIPKSLTLWAAGFNTSLNDSFCLLLKPFTEPRCVCLPCLGPPRVSLVGTGSCPPTFTSSSHPQLAPQAAFPASCSGKSSVVRRDVKENGLSPSQP